jgi:hypothetical protein
MTGILALLQTIASLLEKTVFRQMSQGIFGRLFASKRIPFAEGQFLRETPPDRIK